MILNTKRSLQRPTTSIQSLKRHDCFEYRIGYWYSLIGIVSLNILNTLCFTSATAERNFSY